MKNRKSLGVNASLNILRTILSLLSPLLTYPYISRILGAENIGSINYTNSIIQYFVLLSGLGISTYGIREGAKNVDNKNKLSKFISDCFTINLIFTVISYLLFLILLFAFRHQRHYYWLFIIQSFLILFNTIGIDWVNSVFEDYSYITIRTIVVQTISIILTFTLIKERDDYLLYAIVTVVSTGVVSVLNWLHYRTRVRIKIEKNPNIRIHFKPIFIFFANKMAVNIYVNSDTTMLGLFAGDYYVGLYSVSVKVYTIIKNLLAAFYTVYIPRLAYLENSNEKKFKELYSNLISIMTLIILPASIGLLFLSKEIVLLLFSNEYKQASSSLAILSVAIIFAIYGGLVSSVYDVVKGQEKTILKSTVYSAVLNVSINLIILPIYKANGAALTTLLAEAFNFIFCLNKSKGIFSFIEVKNVFNNLMHSLIGCFEIGVIVFTINNISDSVLFVCVSTVIISVIIYSLTLYLLKNPFALEFKEYLNNKISSTRRRL